MPFCHETSSLSQKQQRQFTYPGLKHLKAQDEVELSHLKLLLSDICHRNKKKKNLTNVITMQI